MGVKHKTTVEDLIKLYWPSSEWGRALAVAKCESGLRPDAHNYNLATGDDSYGVFQVNRLGALGATRPPAEWLLNAENNIKWAYQAWKVQGYKPWSCARKLGIT